MSNSLRVNSIHFCSPIVTTEKIAMITASGRLEYSKGHPLFGTPFPEIIPAVIIPHRTKATRVIFKAGRTIEKESLPHDVEVIPFCLRQLSKLDDLVDECEKRFNKSSRNQCYKILSGAPSEESS